MGPEKARRPAEFAGAIMRPNRRITDSPLGPYARVRSRLYPNRSMPSSLARFTCPAKGSPITHGRLCGGGKKVGEGEGGRKASGTLGLQPRRRPANLARKFPVKGDALARSPRDLRALVAGTLNC